MKLAGYVVVATVWALVLAQLLWRYSQREFPLSRKGSTGPDSSDAALATLYGVLWPVTIPAFVAIAGVLRVSRWLSRLTVSADKAEGSSKRGVLLK